MKTRRTTFWCTLTGREVEAVLEGRGLPGFRRWTVTSCSAFDPASAVTCDRRCVELSYRRRWKPAPPPFTSWRGGADAGRSG